MQFKLHKINLFGGYDSLSSLSLLSSLRSRIEHGTWSIELEVGGQRKDN